MCCVPWWTPSGRGIVRVVSRAVALVLGLSKIATWLILPVVIRSSQRLSHACLSINLLL